MKIYIAGKITGEPLPECKAKFAAAEARLRQLGAAPVNPFKLGLNDTWTFEQCRPFNFKAISHCSAMFMLSDYVNSPGALAEIDEAQRRGLTIFYEDHDDWSQVESYVKIEITG